MSPQASESHDPEGGEALAEAVRIYLAHRQAGSGADDEALLRRYPKLRELLEPMLAKDTEFSGGLRAGLMLGDYRLIELIGAGGMGEVWEAEQLSLQRRVALK